MYTMYLKCEGLPLMVQQNTTSVPRIKDKVKIEEMVFVVVDVIWKYERKITDEIDIILELISK